MSGQNSVDLCPFLSCDWGTSTFRLRFIDASHRKVLAESRGPDGISATFAAWRASGENERGRWAHFRRVIERHLQLLGQQPGGNVAGAPLVISGMASSSIGMRELPYAEMPVALDGSNLRVERIEAAPDFSHPIVLISGVRSEDDIMRGEETQLVGACADLATSAKTSPDRTLIFPGTHSKHVHMRGAQAVRFETYMTGEFFELLARKSILAHSVTPPADTATTTVERPTGAAENTARSDIHSPENSAAFESGVRAGASENLLHACFRVRTRALLTNVPPSENFHYLSGLLIGAELREVDHDVPLTLVGSRPLLDRYRQALRITAARSDISVREADECLIAGQIAIAKRVGFW